MNRVNQTQEPTAISSWTWVSQFHSFFCHLFQQRMFGDCRQRPDVLPDTKPIVSQHWRELKLKTLTQQQKVHSDCINSWSTAAILKVSMFALYTGSLMPICYIIGMVELCAKNLQIRRNDFTDYALTFGQLCANYAHFLPIMRRLCATILKIMRALCQLCAPST